MPRPRDPVRDLFIETVHGTKEKATCKYCGKTYAHNTSRMRNHIAKECNSVPATIKLKFAELVSSTDGASSSSASVNEEYLADNPSGHDRRSTSPTPSSASACTSNASTPASSLDQRGKKRKSIDRFVDSTSTQEKTLLNAAFARAVYASGMPLSSFSSPYSETFFSMIRPSYKVPSPYFLSGPLLNAEFEKCQASNTEKIQKAPALGIMTDSYTNVRHESVIDIVITTPKPVLYKQIYRGQNREVGEYVATELLSVIRELGPEKFWILVTDNAANMKVAWGIVTNEFENITAIGCASHCWNLLFKDLIEIISTVEKYYRYARSIVRQIKVSSNILATLKAKQLEKYGKNAITLKLPGKTRWAGAVILLNSLQKNKAALQETVIDDELNIQNNIRKCVLEPRFWTRIKCISDILTPIHAAITLIESNRALLSDVYFLYRKINNCVLGNMANLRMTAEEKSAVKDLLASRKEFTISSIHLAAYMLDPRYIGKDLDGEETGEAIRCISRLAKQAGIDEGAAIANLGELRNREGFFSTPSIMDSAERLHPASWWKGVCTNEPLAKIAASLLSMPPSAAEVERRWSDHGFIHDKPRNRLLNTRVTKLVTTRSTLVAALTESSTLRPLSVIEMTDYFDKYLQLARDRNENGGDSDGEEVDDPEESDVDQDIEDSDWEYNESDSGEGEGEDSDSEERVRARGQRGGPPNQEKDRTPTPRLRQEEGDGDGDRARAPPQTRQQTNPPSPPTSEAQPSRTTRSTRSTQQQQRPSSSNGRKRR